jgi:hypothetical protein
MRYRFSLYLFVCASLLLFYFFARIKKVDRAAAGAALSQIEKRIQLRVGPKRPVPRVRP